MVGPGESELKREAALASPSGRTATLLRLGLLLLCAGAVVLALACTRSGAGIGGDGVAYVAGARNILQGLGYSWLGPEGDVRPTTIFGPLFPALLSGIGLAGVDSLEGARWLNAALFGVNVALCAAILCRATREAWVPALGAVLVTFSPIVLSTHTLVVSEPTFLALLLGSMIALDLYLERRKRSWLALSAALAGLSYLARFVGLTVIAAGAAIVLLGREGNRRRTLKDLVTYLGVAMLFVVPWFVRNQMAGGSATARSLSYLPPDTTLLTVVAELVMYWFLPERIPLVWRGVTILVAVAFFTAALWRGARLPRGGREADKALEARGSTWTQILGIQILLYGAGVLAARLVLVPRISIDERILLPLLLLVILLMLVVAWRAWSALGGRSWMSRFAVALVFLLAVSYVGRGGVRGLLLQQDGQGFASRTWQQSPLMNALSILPPETPIYTNEVEALYLLGGRSAYRLPTGCLPEDAFYTYVEGTECHTPEFEAWAQAMRRNLEANAAVVALFNTYQEQPYYAPVALELVAGLEILTTQGDGRLYVFDRSQWPESPHW